MRVHLPYFLDDILPFLQALLAHEGHLLYGNDFLGKEASGVVNCPEGTVPYLPEILEYLLGIVLVEQLGYVWISQATRSRNRGHLFFPGERLWARTSLGGKFYLEKEY